LDMVTSSRQFLDLEWTVDFSCTWTGIDLKLSDLARSFLDLKEEQAT
jgi:hypothetical protein